MRSLSCVYRVSLTAFMSMHSPARGLRMYPGGGGISAAMAAASFVPAPQCMSQKHGSSGRAAVRMATEVTFGDESRASLLAGIDAVANAVKVTLGPKGRTGIGGLTLMPPSCRPA